MSSLFEIETKLILMFTKVQEKEKHLTLNLTSEFIEKQKDELKQFTNQLNQYKNVNEKNNSNKNIDQWRDINYGK
jgi:hypothetical protein